MDEMKNVICPDCLAEFFQYPYRDGSFVCPYCRKAFKKMKG